MSIRLVRRQSALTPEQLFDLVIDVESYPRFVPWWEAARISERGASGYRTEQVVRLKLLRQRFSALTTFERPDWIDVKAQGGTLKNFELHWRFRKVDSVDCEVDLTFDLNLAAGPLQKLADRIADDSVRAMLDAFEKEATRRYRSVETFP